MEEFGEQLQTIGVSLSALGLRILPYSFFMYLPTRWLKHVWNRGCSRLVKAIWYATLGFSYLLGGVETNLIVTYICFIEVIDLFFQQLEIGCERNADQSQCHPAINKR